MSLNRGRFSLSDLVKVGDAPPPDSPPLIMGEFCQLISGGPDMLIVDIDGDALTVSWNEGEDTHTFSRATVRRCARSAA
jgi:uncharacterized protein YodC (DUF2158 family)